MSSGFGGSDLNQLKDKDDIEEEEDLVHLVGTRHRSSDPSDAPVTTEEMHFLSANQRPGGLKPSKDVTRILPPTVGSRLHSLGPQPANTLYGRTNQGNTPSRKRGLVAAPNSSEDTRPKKQQKMSVMEQPSEDTDDDEVMESDTPCTRGGKTIQVRNPNETTLQLAGVSSGHPQSSGLFKPRQMNTGPEQQKNYKNGVIGSGSRSGKCGRADSEFVEEVDAIPNERRPTQSTHAGALQNNNSAKWTSPSSRNGGAECTRWSEEKKQITVHQQQRQKSGFSVTKFDLLCFQYGIKSCNIGEDIESLFVKTVPEKYFAVFCVEKQKESRLWNIDVSSIKTVNVNSQKRLFAITSESRSLGEANNGRYLGEANRAVVITLKHIEDVDQFKTKLGEFTNYIPEESEPKYFDTLANSLREWKNRNDADSHQLRLGEPMEPMVTRLQNSLQSKAQGPTVEGKVRRSTRNKMDKTGTMEILPLKRSRGSPPSEPEDSLRETKIPKLELPKPRWETSLVYPPTGPKREVVDYDDLSRLNSDQFLNDNIVNFYLRYIEVQLQKRNPGLAKETYFLNTFFYERLTKRDENGKRREIDSVLKWTAKVDIFKTSYIVVPINESSHWYLAVICNLCHLERKMKDKVPDSPESKPIDLEFKGTSVGTKGDDQDMALENTSDTGVIAGSSTPPDGGEDVEIIGTPDSPEHMAIDEEQPKKGGNLEPHGGKNADEFNYREVIELDDSPSQRLKLKGRGKLKAKEKPSQNKKNYIAPDTPAIIILDSMGFGTSTHASTIKNLRDYLAAEARNKRNLAITKNDIKATYAKAPNQTNWYDCGLYLLHYVERFLDRPKEFAAMFLAKEISQDQELWRKEEIKGMREKLFYLFVKLHEEQEATEMEQKGSKKRTGINANEAKGQKRGNKKGPVKDVMTADVEGSTKDKNTRKLWAGSEPAGASMNQFEFKSQLVNGGDWCKKEKNTPTKLVTQVIGEFEMKSINLEEMEEVEEPNSTPQPREVTLSVRSNHDQ